MLQGSIEAVVRNKEMKEVEIHVNVSRVIRDAVGIVSRWNDSLSSNQSILIVPIQCGVQPGSGQFLFLGKMRLGRAYMKCAPRIENFSTMYMKAVEEGNHHCNVAGSLNLSLVVPSKRASASGRCASVVVVASVFFFVSVEHF